MDRSDLQAMLRFASQNNMMNRPFIQVFKWYNIQYSLAYNEHTMNLMNTQYGYKNYSYCMYSISTNNYNMDRLLC